MGGLGRTESGAWFWNRLDARIGQVRNLSSVVERRGGPLQDLR